VIETVIRGSEVCDGATFVSNDPLFLLPAADKRESRQDTHASCGITVSTFREEEVDSLLQTNRIHMFCLALGKYDQVLF